MKSFNVKSIIIIIIISYYYYYYYYLLYIIFIYVPLNEIQIQLPLKRKYSSKEKKEIKKWSSKFNLPKLYRNFFKTKLEGNNRKLKE